MDAAATQSVSVGRILVADDQSDIVESLRILLRQQGYAVTTANSPATVLRVLATDTFDAVLMDLNYTRDTTSGLEGLSLLAQVHAVDENLPVVVMTACQNTPAILSPSPSASASGTPVRGGRLIEGTFADARTLMPMLANDSASQAVSGLVYDTLYRVDPKTGEPKPNLGTWTISADGLMYTWHIAGNAVWSDGAPITGNDYLVGVEALARSAKTLRAAGFEDIVGFTDYKERRADTISGIVVDGTDPTTFTVRFVRVFCPALTTAFGPAAGPLPAHVFGKYLAPDKGSAIDDAPENTAPPVSSGPFLFGRWKPNDELDLDRNGAYFRGPPLLDGYVLKVVRDATALVTQLKTGEINFGVIEPKDADDIKKRDDLRIYTFQDPSYEFIGWNLKSASTPALADKRVRQALAYGLDTDAVIQRALLGYGVRVYQHHLAGSWPAADVSQLQHYDYDQKKARDLLTQAGFTVGTDGYYQRNGKRLEIAMMTDSGNNVRETMLQMAVEQYARIGVKVTSDLVPFDTMVNTLSSRSKDVPAWIIGWKLSVEADPYGIWDTASIPDPAKGTTGHNFGAFSDPAADRAIAAARTPASNDCGQSSRATSYRELNRLLNDAQPYDFAFSPITLLVAPKALREADPGTFGVYSQIEKWWFAR